MLGIAREAYQTLSELPARLLVRRSCCLFAFVLFQSVPFSIVMAFDEGECTPTRCSARQTPLEAGGRPRTPLSTCYLHCSWTAWESPSRPFFPPVRMMDRVGGAPSDAQGARTSPPHRLMSEMQLTSINDTGAHTLLANDDSFSLNAFL